MELRDKYETTPSIASGEIVNHEGGENTEKDLLAEVEKEFEKLKYYLEELDEIIKEGNFVELKHL